MLFIWSSSHMQSDPLEQNFGATDVLNSYLFFYFLTILNCCYFASCFKDKSNLPLLFFYHRIGFESNKLELIYIRLDTDTTPQIKPINLWINQNMPFFRYLVTWDSLFSPLNASCVVYHEKKNQEQHGSWKESLINWHLVSSLDN